MFLKLASAALGATKLLTKRLADFLLSNLSEDALYLE